MDSVGWAPGGGLRVSFTVKCCQLCCRFEHFQDKMLGKVFPERVTSELAATWARVGGWPLFPWDRGSGPVFGGC